jgi:hypothetical protein
MAEKKGKILYKTDPPAKITQRIKTTFTQERNFSDKYVLECKNTNISSFLTIAWSFQTFVSAAQMLPFLPPLLLRPGGHFLKFDRFPSLPNYDLELWLQYEHYFLLWPQNFSSTSLSFEEKSSSSKGRS